MQIVVVFKGTANAILTSSDNTIVLPAGYYDESTITTNITSLSGTISYLHHQCSNSEVDITYEDDTVGATNTNSVNEKTVNGEIVSDTQGGCYTTPYYYYYEMKTWTNTYTNYVVGYTYDGKADNGQAIVGQIAYQRGDGITRYMGVQLFESEARQQYAIGSSFQSTERVTGKKYSYGTEYAGTLVSTYYLKTCGHTNGELLSVTVTY